MENEYIIEKTWRGTICSATAFEVTIWRAVTAFCIRSVVPTVKVDVTWLHVMYFFFFFCIHELKKYSVASKPRLCFTGLPECWLYVSRELAVTSSSDHEGWPNQGNSRRGVMLSSIFNAISGFILNWNFQGANSSKTEEPKKKLENKRTMETARNCVCSSCKFPDS